MEFKKHYGLTTKDILAVLLLNVTLFLFAPFEIYLTNISEFWFSAGILAKYTLISTLVITIILILILWIISIVLPGLIIYIRRLLLIMGIAVYIQGNFIVSKAGSLDGRTIDWTQWNSERALSILLWLITIMAFIYWATKKHDSNDRKLIITISVVIMLIEAVAISSLFAMKSSALFQKSSYSATSKDEFVMSKNENFIILVLDSFDASRLTEILDSESSGKYCRILGDFTFYPDTLANYGHTDLALPNLITGAKYYNDVEYEEYLKQAYDSSEVLNRIKDENWKVGVYTDSILPSCEIVEKMVNTVNDETVSISSKSRFLKQLYRLVAYKYSPYELKKAFWFYPDFANLKEVSEKDIEGFNWSITDFYNRIDSISPSLEEKVYKVYHLQGTHWPWYITEDVTESEEAVDERETVRGNMEVVSRFLSELKNDGIYDNSSIIILADHGFSQTGADMDNQVNQNPLLLIKGIGESHPLEISDMPLSYSNLQTIYNNLLDGKTDKGILDGVNNTERLFNSYTWDYEKQKDMYFPTITEYRITGNASDMNALEPTGLIYEAP